MFKVLCLSHLCTFNIVYLVIQPEICKMRLRHLPCNLDAVEYRLGFDEDCIDFLQRSSRRLREEEVYDRNERSACDSVDDAEALISFRY